MSDKNHVVELIPAYALDCLDPEEKAITTNHLAECAVCRAELADYRAVAAQLAFAAPEASPSPAIKRRLDRAIQPNAAPHKKSPQSWRQKLVAVARQPVPAWSLAGLFLLLIITATLMPLKSNSALPAPAALEQSAMRTIPMTNTQAAPHAMGLIVISSDGDEGALVVQDLPALHTNRQYQLWLVKNQQRTQGPVFSVDQGGYAAIMVNSPLPLSQYSSFGVTIEPTGGSAEPTGAKVLGCSLGN